ncbi:MAG: DUF1415 domain-containing protein [Proteobacteria bacterium]|nr:DUF1415 domain-containing protein [Pseudomonadota bacterium]
MEDDTVIQAVKQWLESVVVGLNLCPFAKRELAKNRIRFSVTEAKTEEQLLTALETELELLSSDSCIETTLLIHPRILANFDDYNQFLNYADGLLVQMKLEGIYQIASFHPNYQFDGTGPDDSENYTNRSPYPLLHLIREESLERAIADFPDADQIPARNIKLMHRLGRDKLQALLQSCLEGAEKSTS